MNRITCLLSALVLFAGCGGNSSTSSSDKGSPSADDKPLFVVGAQALDAGSCIAKADPSAKLLAQGVLDLAFTSSYTALLLVGNQALQSGSATETERVSLNGAEVSLTTADGAVLGHYSTVGTGFIDAATASAAYATLAVVVIPPAFALPPPTQNPQLLVAKIRVLGTALNGTELTSSELTLPIKVCTGCLVQYPPGAADPTQAAGAGYQCSTSDSEPNAAPPPCVTGQDVPFSCVVCSATYALCRDPTLNPSFSG